MTYVLILSVTDSLFAFALGFFLQSCCHDGHDSEIYSSNCPKPSGICFCLQIKDEIIANT